MTWKAGLSRYLSCLRFFACPESPSSKGVMTWYCKNQRQLQLLNPGMPLMVRTVENAMPAVTAELEWTIDHLLRFMIQTGRFRDPNGTISEARVEAAQAYLKTDWDEMLIQRFKSRDGIDPEKPYLDQDDPDWKNKGSVAEDLAVYFAMKDATQGQMEIFKGGPGDEWTRAENALLMCQRVDLWCAGEKEVERAVVHLYKLGRALNEREVDYPEYVQDYAAGANDFADMGL